MTDIHDQQLEIDEDACLALTGDATQCGNGLDTDASDAEAGLCGVHVDTDAVRVTDFEDAAWVTLRDEFVDILRNETNAYALATLSPDVEDVWHTLTGLQDFSIGPVEFSAGKACSIARDLADHPDLDVDDHPLVVGGCIALQGQSAKNHSCPNGGYGASLLCGMHKDAELRGTVLDDGEPGPDLDTVTVDGAEYQLVEQRDEDLIVVDVDEWELRRLEDAAGAETRWNDAATTPALSDDAETLVLAGCGDAKADEPRAAKDLYTSNYFGLKRRYAEEHGDEWAILSAKYGLLDPDAEIEPYDITVDDIDVGEWGVAVAEDLPDVRDTKVVVLAGPDYAEEIEGTLFLYGADVETPTEGMKIGERMSWLSDQLDAEFVACEECGHEVDREKTVQIDRGDDAVRLCEVCYVEKELKSNDDQEGSDDIEGDGGRDVDDQEDIDIDHDGYPFACYDCADRYEEQPDDEVCSSCGGPVVAVVPLYGLALDAGDTCSSPGCEKPAIWEADQMDGAIPRCAGHASGFRKSQLTMIVDVERPDVDEAGQEDEDDVPPWLWSYDGPARLATYLRENYATTDRAKELAKHFGTVDKFDAASFEEKLRAAGVNGRARNVLLDEYDDVADLQYRARSTPALDELDGIGSQSAHVVGQSFLSWSSTSGAPPQGWNAIVDGAPEIAPDGGRDDEKKPVKAPSSIPKYIREGLEKQSAEDLRTIAGYATELANKHEREAERDLEDAADQDVNETPDEWDDVEWEEELEEAREKAELPAGKGSLTTKAIDGRDYYYLQWREGDKIRSQYVAPVAPADSN